jgi:hypothetical protein
VTQLCKKGSAKKSHQGHARYGDELLERSKRSCKDEIVVPKKKKKKHTVMIPNNFISV